jgi:hypothetical protein
MSTVERQQDRLVGVIISVAFAGLVAVSVYIGLESSPLSRGESE